MKRKIGMNSIAGYEAEKDELRKLINLFKNYDSYEKRGIRLPRGLILQGPPGCGKTLMASALSKECGIPFHYFESGDDETQVLKGLQKTFADAEKSTPSIVYIDEIAELVTSSHFESDLSKQVLKFLLTKLDGYESHGGVMIIASTNNYQDIPSSLTRSGRFDKKIKVDLPDLHSREEIIKYYIKGFKTFDELNVTSLAVKLAGMSGADISTLINNALIEYVDSKDKICVEDFEKLINEMNFETIGKRWKNKSNATKVLIHEVGHAIVSASLNGNCGSISAIRYGDTNGFTKFERDYDRNPFFDDDDFPKDESTNVYTKQELLDDMCISLGGMASERVFLGATSTGSSGDLENTVDMFMALVNCGMLDFGGISPTSLGSSSEYTRTLRDKGYQKLMNVQFKRAIKIIKKRRNLCKYMVYRALINNDSLSKDELIGAISFYHSHKKELDGKLKRIDIELLKEIEL